MERPVRCMQRRSSSRAYRFSFACVGLATAALLLLAPSARAVTFPVSNTDDMGAGSLRQAIMNANTAAGPDVVDATGVSGTINLESQLPFLTQEIEIRGPGASTLTVRRGAVAAFRIFSVLATKAEISGLTITNGLNSSLVSGGAGILNSQGTLTLRDSVVTENVNAGTGNNENGGGIDNLGASPSSPATTMIIDSTVSDNTAAGYGAGIMNEAFGTLTLRNSTVSGNIAQGGAGCVGGGGIHTEQTLIVENSTVTGNMSPPNGPAGGILSCSEGGSTTITNSTIARNSASPGRPANLEVVQKGTVPNSMTLQGAIVAGPLSGGPNCFVDGMAVLASNGYNVADDSSCNLTGATDQPGTNPLLGALADNGGPTQTMALAPNSPAVDRGVSSGLAMDQRGLTRPIDFPSIQNAPGGDGSDVGAFELQALPASDFSFGKLKRNKKKGTATLTVIVPGPGTLDLRGTNRVKGQSARAAAPGAVKFAVGPTRNARRKLRRLGKAKVGASVTYTPEAGQPSTRSRTIKLIKR